MKILHTADWHLGQKFFHVDRQKEHEVALNWLANYIITEEIELLIVAGDIFDTDSPPNYARKLYYDFLKSLINTCCKDIIIVGGNHDSANMLDASKELFKLLNVYVVGHITELRKDQIIELKKEDGSLKAVIGAVPFLRDKDIRKSISGQGDQERVESLRLGIKEHYYEIEQELLPYQNQNIPIIVTGHLYAAGGDRGDRTNSIHIGSLDVIDAANFSNIFDYVALGHLHRHQQIDKERPIWYSGALIPMDFSEFNDDKVVRVIEFDNKKIVRQQAIKVPLARYLISYKGNLDYIKNKLEKLETDYLLPTWLKIEVETSDYHLDLDSELKEIILGKSAEILMLNQKKVSELEEKDQSYHKLQSLQQLTEIEVFRMCSQQKGPIKKEDLESLEHSFKELLGWMQESDVD